MNEPPYYPRPRIKRQTDTVTVRLRHLPPYSRVLVRVRVLNKYYAGPPSDVISFETMEGSECASFPGCVHLKHVFVIRDISFQNLVHQLCSTWQPEVRLTSISLGSLPTKPTAFWSATTSRTSQVRIKAMNVDQKCLKLWINLCIILCAVSHWSQLGSLEIPRTDLRPER